jgi:probable rRNA maturation factor
MIRSLNKRYLQHDVATDVLAFDLKEDVWNKTRISRLSKKKKREIIGEIIISTERAMMQAKTYQTTYRKELLLYIIHGILHLQGYDDHGPRKTACMRLKENELLRLVE